jgi:CheY-like chemotaxis protein
MKEKIMNAPRKILVVDDDPVVSKSIDRVLTGKGYAVITAATGEEALGKLSNENYDVVFTDIKMPGMSGLEVAERVKASQPWLPVVIITGYGTGANEARAEAAGVSGFLHKPLSPEMIEGSTEKALLERDAVAAAETAVEAETAPVAAAELDAQARYGRLKNVALFLAAPFIGLAYIAAMPAVGVGMLAWFGLRALARRARSAPPLVKHVAMLVAAPFIGLAYMVGLPFVGLGMLVWFGAKAVLKRA